MLQDILSVYQHSFLFLSPSTNCYSDIGASLPDSDAEKYSSVDVSSDDAPSDVTYLSSKSTPQAPTTASLLPENYPLTLTVATAGRHKVSLFVSIQTMVASL